MYVWVLVKIVFYKVSLVVELCWFWRDVCWFVEIWWFYLMVNGCVMLLFVFCYDWLWCFLCFILFYSVFCVLRLCVVSGCLEVFVSVFMWWECCLNLVLVWCSVCEKFIFVWWARFISIKVILLILFCSCVLLVLVVNFVCIFLIFLVSLFSIGFGLG